MMTKIGKYEIIEEIGQGAMGVVYKAYDPVIRREVAIKVLMQSALALPEMKARFYREAQSVGMLYHENITIVHDIGEIEGRLYLVMEYLPGTDLRALIAGNAALTLSQKLDYVKQVCCGLQFAHAKGVVHRDIKPENIKILPDGKVKLMDFGIARPEASELTQTGTMLGTPCYMSPEQVKGGKVDKRADIFALGVVLYELLLYKKPFDGQMATVIYKILHEEPAPIEVSLSGVTGDLQNLIAKCLAKSVEARYGDCAEIITILEKISAEVKQQEQKVEALLAQARALIAQKKNSAALPGLEEILQLAPAHAEARTLKEQCAIMARPQAPAITPTVADQMIGATVSHYKILSQLGAGGMGVIYKAEDLRLKRPVALKFLAPALTADAAAKERFIREAQAASALDHPNICTIYEIDETPIVPRLSALEAGSQLFIAMAYYDGQILKEKTGLAPSESLDFVMQMAQGLAKAHEHGIVHRDVKPANAIVTKDGLLKILDFGLAKLAGATKITRTDMTAGTLAYMSPEQVQGLEADHRTDIWSLGVILFQLLTGHLPFSGEYQMSLFYSIVHEDPAPLLQFNSRLPAEFDQVIGRALQKEAAARYEAMPQMLEALQQIQRRHYRRKEHEALAPREKIVKPAVRPKPYFDEDEKTKPLQALPARPPSRENQPANQSAGKKILAGVVLAILVGVIGLWQFGPKLQTPDSAVLSTAPPDGQNEMPSPNADTLNAGAGAAKKIDEAADADLATIKERVNGLKQDMLNAKAEAEKAEAKTKARELFDQGAANEKRGNENFAANDRRGYLAAQNFYAEAHNFYKQARAQAILAVSAPSAPNPRLAENAETARHTMLKNKRQIVADDKAKAASATYQSALEKENAGEQQFRGGNLGAAQNAFDEAGKLYSRAGEEFAALSAKSQAETARNSMLAAERNLSAVNRAGAMYEEAQRLAAEAEQAYYRGDFIRAGAAYQAAQERYENVARVAAEDAARENASATAAQNAIQNLLDRLKIAIEKRNLQGMKDVYGASFTQEDEKSWQVFFKGGKNIEAWLVPSDNFSVPRKNTARIKVMLNIRYNDIRNDRKQSSFSEIWQLALNNGKWIITSKEKV